MTDLLKPSKTPINQNFSCYVLRFLVPVSQNSQSYNEALQRAITLKVTFHTCSSYLSFNFCKLLNNQIFFFLFKMLLEMGAAVNISSRSWNHATSLHFCSQLGKMENLKLLLKYGANVFIKDKCGLTARDRAQKHPECAKILQEQEGQIQS